MQQVADITGGDHFNIPGGQSVADYADDLMLTWDYTHEYTNPVTPEGWPRSSTGPRISPSEHFTMQVGCRALGLAFIEPTVP